MHSRLYIFGVLNDRLSCSSCWSSWLITNYSSTTASLSPCMRACWSAIAVTGFCANSQGSVATWLRCVGTVLLQIFCRSC